MAFKFAKTAKLNKKTVFLRVDVNEPLENGKVADDFRLQKIVPTIQHFINQGCKVILAGHLGRPNGRMDQNLSLRPVAERLAELLGRKFLETDHRLPDYAIEHLIFFTGNLEDKRARLQVSEIARRDLVMLENLRFYKGEEANSAFFAKQLSELADVYVNDAFGVDHRKAASLVAITKYLPSYVGLQLEKEIRALDFVLHKSKKPLVVMMAGIKISDKAKTLEHLGKKAEKVLLAGGIANELLLAQGYEVGVSNVEKGGQKIATQLLRNFKNKLILPIDAVVANQKDPKASTRVVSVYNVKKNEAMFDIGPKTILAFAAELKKAKTIVWNGPLGWFEHKPFDTGTMSLARVIGGISQGKAFSVVGGGETVDAVRLSVQADYIDHLSTGGGAMLAYLAGEKLPGIEALR